MKIVNIVPGFGGTFYCGNCLRDSAFVRSLRELGHEAVILPLYLPLEMPGGPAGQEAPVFYGAVSIYLRQQFPVFRHMPGWMEALFDSRPLVKLAARKAGSTRAHGLEQLTESMLLGEKGNQRPELERLARFLKDHEKPDVVHFSNALLLGLAEMIREEVSVPVVCSLQDEDVWVDAMEASWRKRIWDLMAEKAAGVDAFVAVSNWFAGVMQEKMKIPAGKMNVIHIGVQPDNYPFSLPADSPRAVGYLSRICEENGFGVLVDAFIMLKEDPRFDDLELKISGGMTGDDRPFLHAQEKKLRDKGLMRCVEFRDDFTQVALRDFFEALTVLSVPVLKGEAFGLYQVEALASGVPLVQPELGAFPEIIGSTGGGVLYRPNTPGALAEALACALSDRPVLERMSRNGRKSAEELFDCRKLTVKMVGLYEKIIRE
jgi:glycosyltransferase involved in cell wall biosynthesis